MNVYFETERLIIRDPIVEDFDSIWEMRKDEDVTEFTGGVTRLTCDEAYEKHLKRCDNCDDTAKEYSVIIKETNDYIGYCGFQYCTVLNGLEILYGYAKKYWGNGYAIEAAKAVLEFGITKLNLDEIVAAVNYENVASDKVLIKIGMNYVGDIEWPEQGMVKKYNIKS
ncbi:GNAT family N-acetyltransferase [Fusibacter bizertensis]|uniref:GNAT family N-acetyltransferase n=1 Tax=Fusibacter bizertensis TaxID=1488331 RepID=A0ABT6NHR2_9FIRM|nr:GNAT family N-acetyltransferase [Fusibacter bizertensis]MDH8679932.1 GNAT family N-acetyltransferase [Fusibacter bizertensis]